MLAAWRTGELPTIAWVGEDGITAITPELTWVRRRLVDFVAVPVRADAQSAAMEKGRVAEATLAEKAYRNPDVMDQPGESIATRRSSAAACCTAGTSAAPMRRASSRIRRIRAKS